VIVALAGRQLNSLGATAGLFAVYAFAARGGLLQLAAIRRQQTVEGTALTPALVGRAAAQRLGPSLGAALVADAVLLPFLILGDVPGNEIANTAAAVIMGGLVTATLLTVVVLPALCLWVGSPAPESAEELEYELVLRPKEPSVMSS
jgi:cobalt-zinc-cadmium resistance protein CzcA